MCKYHGVSMVEVIIHYWDAYDNERKKVGMTVPEKATWNMDAMYRAFNAWGFRGKIIKFETFSIN